MLGCDVLNARFNEDSVGRFLLELLGLIRSRLVGEMKQNLKRTLFNNSCRYSLDQYITYWFL